MALKPCGIYATGFFLVDRSAKMSYNMGTVNNKEPTMNDQTSLEDSWTVVKDYVPTRRTYWVLAAVSAISMAIIVVASLGWLNP
jgi:hypothetical protein